MEIITKLTNSINISIVNFIIILSLTLLIIITLIIAIIALRKASKINKKYNAYMTGEDGKSIEKTIIDNIDTVKKIEDKTNSNTINIEDINNKLQYTFQKVGIIKYDAFHEMGGKLSFALCMLDRNDSGFILNVMHSNAGCFSYIKEVVNGKAFLDLGDEEAEALNQAIAGKMGDVDLGKKINDIIQK